MAWIKLLFLHRSGTSIIPSWVYHLFARFIFIHKYKVNFFIKDFLFDCWKHKNQLLNSCWFPCWIRKRKLCDGSTNPNLEPICGRPLGLKFNTETCHLYIADAYFGLLMVEPNGGVAQKLATSAEGIPFRFMNGLDIDTNTGMIYFTDSSIIFQRRYLTFLSLCS